MPMKVNLSWLLLLPALSGVAQAKEVFSFRCTTTGTATTPAVLLGVASGEESELHANWNPTAVLMVSQLPSATPAPAPQTSAPADAQAPSATASPPTATSTPQPAPAASQSPDALTTQAPADPQAADSPAQPATPAPTFAPITLKSTSAIGTNEYAFTLQGSSSDFQQVSLSLYLPNAPQAMAEGPFVMEMNDNIVDLLPELSLWLGSSSSAAQGPANDTYVFGHNAPMNCEWTSQGNASTFFNSLGDAFANAAGTVLVPQATEQ